MKRSVWIGKLCACTLSIAACGSSGPTTSGLIGNQNALDASSVITAPGHREDPIAWLVNQTGQTVTLESATIMPLRGYRTPELAHVAVERTGSQTTFRGLETAGADHGWPPSQVRVTRFRGYRLRSGGPLVHHTALIVFAVVAPTIGRYAVAGLNVTVREDRALVKVRAIATLGLCSDTKRHAVSCPQNFSLTVLRAAETAAAG